MTKSTITKERLEEIVSDPMINQGSEFAMMARMALAAMDSEPVAWTWHYREQWHVTNDKCRAEFVATDGDVAVLPLYRHAQPVPVVPDELLKEYLRLVQCMLSDYRDGNYGNAQRWIRHIAKASDDFERKYGLSPWEMARKTCRAAMLAAAPQSSGSEPATVPGKWIPVSERMPEVGVKVLCFPVEGEPIHAVFNGQLWLQDISWSNSDEPIDNVITCNVTHWMPLPAAPQESKP
ncbi:DUF551 domain-containing protein [Klebsiella pneumoniae]|jgi:hypothetical protein|nr:DUF551 domain-containing protein [Klebsiella pneumoniae]DAT51889.1 MAG TPA: Protein of unknown function (DUF551) [Bacteriophage sp.]MCY0673755.1 DUF551 domain-containing protein [Klebsiella pneumoniae]MDG0575933.1 DUF551 domain-containing protein [Klebsiella pneumoniae]MDG0597703.1 DUF551 domain-containing protein [Klebsiella pneumoniae]MDG0597773.1 DUF551 domain-containing protein [Klebsiella pneumoniae]